MPTTPECIPSRHVWRTVAGTANNNTIEGFWGMLKWGINGTYISVSQKHLQTYLNEFEFR